MPLLRKLPAGPLIDHGPHPSPFPANFQYAPRAWRSRTCSRTAPKGEAGAQLRSLPWTPARTSASLSREMAVQL